MERAITPAGSITLTAILSILPLLSVNTSNVNVKWATLNQVIPTKNPNALNAVNTWQKCTLNMSASPSVTLQLLTVWYSTKEAEDICV